VIERRCCGTLWIPLDRIRGIQVLQNRRDRWLQTGTLRLTFHGGRPFILPAIRQPFEAWKRIKIAKFESERPS